MTTTQTIARKLENEIAKSKTDTQTWDTVAWFWGLDVELPEGFLAQCLDRVQLLEARMCNQHGWQR